LTGWGSAVRSRQRSFLPSGKSSTIYVEPWCRGLTCLPVTQETAGSNPVGSAIYIPRWAVYSGCIRGIKGFCNSLGYSYAVVAELADALDSGSSGVTAVEVRVLSTAYLIPPTTHSFINLRTWLSGRASPCQGEGRGFESLRPLHLFCALSSAG
jgi:hypothetical protein